MHPNQTVYTHHKRQVMSDLQRRWRCWRPCQRWYMHRVGLEAVVLLVFLERWLVPRGQVVEHTAVALHSLLAPDYPEPVSASGNP